jgi:uncharacterized protein YjbI with pentapeptide repeats
VLLSAAFVGFGHASPVAHAGSCHVMASSIERSVKHGDPVDVERCLVDGRLKLGLTVSAPLVLRHDTLTGTLQAKSTEFTGLLDLRGSRLLRGASFSAARFDGPAVFAGVRERGRLVDFDLSTFSGPALFGAAVFGSRTTFAGAEFDGPAHFRGAQFKALADFDSATFRDSSDFTGSNFGGDSRFDTTSFGSVADFSGSYFRRSALFAAARFSEQATFLGAHFWGRRNDAASFRSTRFDGGATFLDSDFHSGTKAMFDEAQATSDLIFDGVEFPLFTSFVASRLLGQDTFAQAQLQGTVDFDEAVLSDLNLDGADFADGTQLYLPTEGQQTGHLDELRLDPNDVRFVGLGNDLRSRSRREHALKLIEAAARRGGDMNAANSAYAARRQLLRHDRPWYWRAPDWLFLWLAAGYLVLWWHPILLVLALLLISAVARLLPWPQQKPVRRILKLVAPGVRNVIGAIARLRLSHAGRLIRYLNSRRFWHDANQARIAFLTALGQSFGALWNFHSRMRGGSRWCQFEAVLYAIGLLVLVDTLANVWPSLNNIVRGVLL